MIQNTATPPNRDTTNALRYCSGCGFEFPSDTLIFDAPCLFCAKCDALPLGVLIATAKQTAVRQWRQSRKRPGKRIYSALPAGKKQCPCCEHTKLRSEFSADHARFDGLQAYCKTCQRLRRLVRASDTPELWPTVRAQLRAIPPV